MERYEIAGRTVLDDTAAHPDSLRATLDVSSMLRCNRTVVVYAVRGMRGVDINHRNARALADLTQEYAVSTLVVTAAAGAAGPADRVTAEEAASANRARSMQPSRQRRTAISSFSPERRGWIAGGRC
jgi:hypothetical protein